MTQARLFGERYELGELIGFGGMAEVHRGHDVRLGRRVAIKVLRADLARDPSFLTRFRREAQAAARLNHPAIVAVYDTGEDVGPNGSVPYIIMEYIEGRTLRDVLRAEGTLPATRAMEIMAEIDAALDYSHQAGIVHRDIKPANVMITGTGAVKVMDFGIARAVADDSATVTQTAAVIGTAQYLSPEQARGESVDARSDVYSCGCLLYELVTGRPPFVGDSPVAVAYQHVREVPPLPSTINPGLPRQLDSVIMKALAKNPQNRYQTAGEMGNDLSRILADQPVRAETALTDAERTQFIARPGGAAAPAAFVVDDIDDHVGARRGALLWGVLVAALLIIIAIVGFLILRSPAAKPVQATVPNLIGRTVDQATSDLHTANLVPGTPTMSNGPCGDPAAPITVKEGNVCTQDIPANSQKPEQTTVNFTVFKQGTIAVPSVVGLTFDQARTGLIDAKLVPVPVDTNDPRTPGQVIGQDPPAGAQVAPNAPITLQVANGKTVLPDVRGKNDADARTLLNQAQFINITDTATVVVTDPAQVGLVQSQNPSAGTPLTANTPITLTLGAAPPPPPPPSPSPTPTPTPTCTTRGAPPATPPLGNLPDCATTPAG